MNGQTTDVTRLYLDFDSFFASAEQHFNPALRGKPVGVVPLDSPHTACIAVSREAKAKGVKSNTTIKDAREIIPDMIFVVARHDAYVRLHNRILEVVESCLPIAAVRSIDELVCTLLPCEAAEGKKLAHRIKAALRETFSDVLTCSIGMAPSELLAKIGAEMHKPNGFALLETRSLPRALSQLPLTKLPGVSTGMKGRLSDAGVRSFDDLWALAPKQARAIWGSVEGERFWNGLHGYHSERPETIKRMFGHSRMLPADWRNAEKIDACARQLLLSASRRLRRADVRATKLTLGFRGGIYRLGQLDSGEKRRWVQEAVFAPSRDDQTFITALSDTLACARQNVGFAPRSVSVMLHGLVEEEAITPDLFDNVEGGRASETKMKWEGVSDLVDALRSRHGPDAISLGPRVELPGGYLGAKIAFGRIPDAADFSDAPTEDNATQFLSVATT